MTDRGTDPDAPDASDRPEPSDPSDSSDPLDSAGAPRSARPGASGLPSARESARGGKGGKGGRRGRGPRSPGGSAPRPTPARALSESHGAPEPEEPESWVEIDVDGRPWTVRVLGRSEGGRHVGPAPLMLLGFWRGGVAEANGDPDRELLTVGRGLATLSPVELLEALDRARARVAPDEPRPFFADPGERRRR